MKRVVKDLKTGLFFKNMDEWTALIDEAANFRDSRAALQFCEKNNLNGIAVVLSYLNGAPEKVLAFEESSDLRPPSLWPSRKPLKLPVQRKLPLFRFLSCPQKFNNRGQNGDEDDHQDHQGEIVTHKGKVSKEIARQSQSHNPKQTPAQAERDKPKVRHSANSGHEGSKCPHNWNKTGNDNGFPPRISRKTGSFFQDASGLKASSRT
jgi:hypothetical protein